MGVQLLLCYNNWVKLLQQRLNDLQRLKYLLSDPLQKKLPIPGLEGNLDSQRVNIILQILFHSPSGSHTINQQSQRYWPFFLRHCAGHIRCTGLAVYVRVSAKPPLWGMIDQIESFLLLFSLRPCCGLNVCVSPKFICWNPNLKCDGIRQGIFGRCSGHEDGACMNGISALIKETPES